MSLIEAAMTMHERGALADIKAIAFDIQGTCVDFYQPLMRRGQAVNLAKNINLDWSRLSAAWRELYRAEMDDVIAGSRRWIRVDQIYRRAFDVLLDREQVGARFAADERDNFCEVWSQLDPWPDSVDGLGRIRRRFTTATLSNAGMAAIISICKHAGLPFDAVLTAELCKSYKPSPAVYQLAIDYLGCEPGQILMVACHKYDLAAARAFGMRTAFVARPLEFGPHASPDVSAEPWLDLHVQSLQELATALGT
jgi:2-haloacid dehalogenase